jgi:hypothetical protein
MPRKLRVRVLLNKGRQGISLHKLPKMLTDIQQFLDMLSEDVEIGTNKDWFGFEFSNSSLGYVAVKNDPVEDHQAKTFNETFKAISERRPTDRVRRSTSAQYARIADPIDPDETVNFGLEEVPSGQPETQQPEVQWLELTKEQAFLIAREAQAKVGAFGAIQGVLHSLYLGAHPPHFHLRELSSGDLVDCFYDREKHYGEIVSALKKENAVLHVYGYTVTDLPNRRIEQMRITRIEVAEVLSPDDFDKFFGCAPGITGELDLQEFIKRSRGRG